MTSATPRPSSFLSDHDPRAHNRRRKAHRKPDNAHSSLSEEANLRDTEPDVAELRRRRAEFYTITPKDQRMSNPIPMGERVHPRSSSNARLPPVDRPEAVVREVRETRTLEHRHRHRKTKAVDADNEPEHVYVYRPKSPTATAPTLRRSKTTRITPATRPTEARRSSGGPTRHHTERKPSHRQENQPIVKRAITANHLPESIARSRSHRDRPSVTSSLREKHEATPSITKSSQRPPSFLGSILGKPKAPPPPEK
ncbi:MAG: hypothetical protein Q9170_007726, partial [Blastenia crenularia]